MSLNSVPSAERVQISFFGKTNAGKSCLINAVTNQNISIVSDIKGTTTDPVKKAMELLPLGAVLITDTAGYNDNTELGTLRMKKTLQVLSSTDIAVLVTEAKSGLTDEDREFIKLFQEKNIKYIIVYNKCDLIKMPVTTQENEIYVSALKNININELKNKIASISGVEGKNRVLIRDLIKENDIIFLVTPIDSAAPKGRLILPQQQVLRDILDGNGICITVKETQLKKALEIYPKPKLVITDSQVFKFVNSVLPGKIHLTSFSILFARYKGILETAVEGVKSIENLKDGDIVLISEGCTHHRQCDDIGTVKLPMWLKNYTKKDLKFEFTSGHGFMENLNKYGMVIQCGGCMLNDNEVLNRYYAAKKQNIPISNYGITIAYINGILERSVEIFPSLKG